VARRLLNARRMTNIKLGFLSVFVSVSANAAAPVVGGHGATVGEWPDVALVVAPMALCTGTLVAPDVVLTAGHCIDTHPVEVVIGTVDYAKPGGEVIAVTKAIAYPDWQHQYDVGVLVLAHAAKAKPRAIASACAVKDGAKLRVVGFGLTTASGTGDNSRLNEADVVVTDARCTSVDACNANIAPDAELAAGGHGTDSCFGDSGGPAFLATNAGPALVGVVSRGEGAAGAPCGGGGVYERADKVAAWIEQTTHRKLARTVCDNKADEEGEASAGGGCSAGGELAGGTALLLLVGALWVYNSAACRKSR
jgi:endonuclease G